MATQTKMVQLDLFRNEKVELDEKLKKERDDSLRRQVRNLFHLSGDYNKRIDLLEETVGCLVDFMMDREAEKSPD